jgi:aromatic-L-amino-acid/L-tryptophan decarboxylase
MPEPPTPSPEEVRARGERVAAWIADYLAGPPRHAVFPETASGDTRALLPAHPPERGEPLERVMADLDRIILPRLTHWNHPGFLAYFAISASESGVWAEAISAALNVNAMLWRTAPAATELEEVTLSWLGEMLGLPPEMSGVIQDTASTSTLVALAAARHRASPEARVEGLTGPPLRIYCSAEAHSSVEKAALVLGLGTGAVRRVAVDGEFRLRPDAFREAVREDRAAGLRPCAVVATAGTTVAAAVDPVPEIAEICEAEGLWLHVDAAYGGSAAVVPEMRWVLAGAERADSVVVNPHKWLFVPIDCSALFMRDREEVKAAFSVVPEYLATADEAVNLMDYGPALGRRFRALKLWMTIRQYGREGLAGEIRRHVALARLFHGWVESEPGWEVLAPTHLSVVSFRYSPPGARRVDLDDLNRAIVAEVNRGGSVFLSTGRLGPALAIRVAVGNIRTRRAHLESAWEQLRSVAARLSP